MPSEKSGQSKVGLEPRLIVPVGARGVRLFNLGPGRIFYGDRAVDTGGSVLLPGEKETVTVGETTGIYGVVAALPESIVTWSDL